MRHGRQCFEKGRERVGVGWGEWERDRERDRRAGRKADRQKERERYTKKQRGRQTDRQRQTGGRSENRFVCGTVRLLVVLSADRFVWDCSIKCPSACCLVC